MGTFVGETKDNQQGEDKFADYEFCINRGGSPATPGEFRSAPSRMIRRGAKGLSPPVGGRRPGGHKGRNSGVLFPMGLSCGAYL